MTNKSENQINNDEQCSIRSLKIMCQAFSRVTMSSVYPSFYIYLAKKTKDLACLKVNMNVFYPSISEGTILPCDYQRDLIKGGGADAVHSLICP